jgi:nucleoside-diphosphate-sugar epimerase
MRVLLTGSKGFIGSHIEFQLKLWGFEVIGLDRKIDGESIIESVKSVGFNFDAVVHCAANLYDRFDENYNTTKELTRIFDESRFVFLSSAAVYGNCVNASEEDALFPSGIYGLTKYREESEVKDTEDHVIFRLSNVYGPGTDHGFVHLCMNQDSPKLNFIDHIRDYIHVDDIALEVARSLTKVTNGYIYPSGIYNLSTGFGIRNIDVFKKIRPFETPIVQDEAITKNIQEIAVSTLDPGKAKDYGFRPRSF